jgi:carboxyl-terminal processing protease
MFQFIMRPKRILLLGMAVVAGLAIWAGCVTAKSSGPPPEPPTGLAAKYKSDPNDPRIAYVTAMLLGQYQYMQRPLDTQLSEKFFDDYVNSLDPRHENFLQPDIAQFSVYRTNLDLLTTGGHGVADLTPAYAIYQRLTERVQQHNDYVNELLKQDKFKFTADEKIQIDRRHEPFPKDLDEAKALWKQRLRYEYLQEKLAQEISETNGNVVIKLPAGAGTNITDTLTRRYRGNLHSLTNMDGDNILQAYLESLAHAYDPHTDYFSAPKAQDFSIEMSLSLFGIGAQLREEDGYCKIMELVPGGPAAKSKLLNPEDRIVAVAQGGKPPVDVVDMELEKVVQLIRGPKNSEVRLTISPVTDRGSRHVVTLIRDEIKMENAETKAQLIVYPDGKKIGVIDVPSFYAPIGPSGGQSYVSVDTAKLIRKLKAEKVDGIIVDLRTNPGGSLEEAVKFTGLFIKDGPVVQTRDADGQISVDADPDPRVLYDGPLVVMINRFSASASEIAAAALQDYGRAIIVGDISTHGKGTVQSLSPLRPFVWPATANATNDPGQLKITKGKFYRITGASTQLKGVASDIVLPDELDHSPFVGETALDNPLPWDTIQPADFTKLNLVQPYLDELRRRSAARIATNQDFTYVNQNIAEYEKAQEDRTATINEHDAIAEREKITARNKSREAERKSRPVPEAKIYDLTVENAANPELPAPTSYFTTNDVATTVKSNVTLDQISSAVAGLAGANGHSETNSNLHLSNDLALTNNLNVVANANSSTNQIAKPVVTRTPTDAALEEAKLILEDYISLLSKNSIQMVGH